MSADPFAKATAEAVEELKELRRQGAPTEGTLLNLQQRFRAVLDDIVRQGVPERFSALVNSPDASRVGFEQSGNLFRNLNIQALANRVFGDEEKAEAWLNRPNLSLGGQKPLDLLKDEIGAEVVREKLEQIDHGIFA